MLGDWQVTLIERISSGFPVPLIDSNNQSGTTFNTGGNDYNYNRPDRVAGCNPYAANHGQYQWINSACFVAPPAGAARQRLRVSLSPDPILSTPTSRSSSNFALPWREMGLNFRAEFFNLFNHPQFGTPINDINEPSVFGSVNSTVNNPRLVQLALKLSF